MSISESAQICRKLEHYLMIIVQPESGESVSFIKKSNHRIKSSSPEKNCDPNNKKRKESLNAVLADSDAMKLVPPQWVQCDLRNLNLSTLGKFTGKKSIFLNLRRDFHFGPML